MSEKVNLSATFSEPDHLATNYRKPEDQPVQGDPLAFDISEYNAQQAQNVQDAYNARTDTDVESRLKAEAAVDFIGDKDGIVAGGMQARYVGAAGSRETIGAVEHSHNTSEKRTPSTELELYRKAPESTTSKKVAEADSKEPTVEEGFQALQKELADLRVKNKGMTPQEMQALLDKAEGEFNEASAGVDELNEQYGRNQSNTAGDKTDVDAPGKLLDKLADATRIHDKDVAQDQAILLNNKWDTLTENIDEKFDATRLVADKYAEVSANQRGGHLGRLERGNAFKRFMRRINPLSRRHERADQVVEEQRDLFRQNVQEYVTLLRGAHSAEFHGTRNTAAETTDVVDEKLSLLNYVEDRIQEYRNQASHSGVLTMSQGEDLRRYSTRDRIGNWIAGQWQSSGRVGKVLKVGATAAAVGLGMGFAVATAGAGPLLTTGIGAGVSYGGKRFGNLVGDTASRRMSATEEGRNRNQRRAVERRTQITDNIRNSTDQPAQVAESLDITEAVEDGTTREVRENRRRRNLAGLVGGLAAGAGFASGLGLEHAFNGSSHHAANTQADPKINDPKVADPKTVQPGGGQTGNVLSNMPNPDQYPWSVAHGVTPGHEMTTIQHAMDAWNKVHSGAGLHFANVGNTMQIHTAHGAALNHAQQIAFNKAMELGLAA